MKKALTAAVVCLSFASGMVFAQRVHDWHDLDKVHNHVLEAIHEMDNARAANHYDMDGHGAKAEEFLHGAERELGLAIESARRH